jgi:hypothetical protein
MKKLSNDQIKLIVEEAKKRKHVPFDVEKFCFDKQLTFINDPARYKTAVCSRRCLAEDTLIQTINGPKKIQDIKIGDWVFDEHGCPIKVINTFNNGNKEVVEVLHNQRLMFEATMDHVMLTYHHRAGGIKERPLKDFYDGVKIVRNEIDRNTSKHVKYAYAIGALLGDGCSRVNYKSFIIISSEDELIPNKVGELLNASRVRKCHVDNYNYSIYLEAIPQKYLDWCNKKYAHEKICDINEILTWDRPSRLAFIAGLIDTDGSVYNATDGIQIDISMQAKSVIDAAQLLFLDLWQYKPTVHIDDRPKYKNGPVYVVRLKHNYFGKKILKDLDPYLVTPRKKWKDEYELKLENNYNANYVGVKFGNKSVKPTYDIHVDSPSNLYMLANGLITHNSGKSLSCAAHLVSQCTTKKNQKCVYITLTRGTAKKIVWKEIMEIIKSHNLNVECNNTDLTITFLDTNSMIYFSGASKKDEVEKFRGLSLNLVYIDEVQSFKPFISELIDEVLAYTVLDTAGTIALIGTPGPIPGGFFYETTHSIGWSNHKWTVFDNPHIKLKTGLEPAELLRQERERRGISENDPAYLREALGMWIQDSDSLVFKYNPSINNFNTLPDEDLVYIFGVDLGYNDSDAVAVLGYSRIQKKVFLVEEWVKDKQGITELAEQIKLMIAKYKPVKIKIDAGALGKKISEELIRRHQIPVEASDKHRKMEYIEFLNDDLRTGKFMIKSNSITASDAMLLTWDIRTKDKRTVSSEFHSDILDAVLYAHREAKHYFAEAPVTKNKSEQAKVDEFWDQQAQLIEVKKIKGEWWDE